MIKIVLCGCCGRMGGAVSLLAEETSVVKIVAGIDRSRRGCAFPVFACPEECAADADAVVDFSHPCMTDGLLDFCVKKRLPLVSGTTGLTQSQHERMKEAAEKIPVFYAANMSWGVYVFNKLVTDAAKLLYGEFDIEIIEKHHRQKADAPSGTALTLLKNIQKQIPLATPVFGRCGGEKRKEAEIGINSVRGGTITGQHEVIFAGLNETIEIRHTAQSKQIFAQGALKAAAFIVRQGAGLYGMDDLAEFYAGGENP